MSKICPKLWFLAIGSRHNEHIDSLLPMRAKFGVLEQTQGLQLQAKFHLNVYLYSAFFGQGGTLKALRHGPHSFTCKQHHACLSFVSIHQMAPPKCSK